MGDYNFSNSSTILLNTSNPPCQNFAERMSRLLWQEYGMRDLLVFVLL
jgi:hypothetical protein